LTPAPSNDDLDDLRSLLMKLGKTLIDYWLDWVLLARLWVKFNLVSLEMELEEKGNWPRFNKHWNAK
jgi:hypothetical protein